MIDPANLSTPSHLLTARLIQPAYQDDQELDFDVIVGRRPGAGADLLRTIRAIAQDNFGTAQESFAAALSSEQTINFLINRGRVVLFLRQAAQRGYGDRLLTALTERGLADCHWPLQAAFDAYLYGEARLKDVNPEVRGAARRIYDWLDAPGGRGAWRSRRRGSCSSSRRATRGPHSGPYGSCPVGSAVRTNELVFWRMAETVIKAVVRDRYAALRALSTLSAGRSWRRFGIG